MFGKLLVNSDQGVVHLNFPSNTTFPHFEKKKISQGFETWRMFINCQNYNIISSFLMMTVTSKQHWVKLRFPNTQYNSKQGARRGCFVKNQKIVNNGWFNLILLNSSPPNSWIQNQIAKRQHIQIICGIWIFIFISILYSIIPMNKKHQNSYSNFLFSTLCSIAL